MNQPRTCSSLSVLLPRADPSLSSPELAPSPNVSSSSSALTSPPHLCLWCAARILAASPAACGLVRQRPSLQRDRRPGAWSRTRGAEVADQTRAARRPSGPPHDLGGQRGTAASGARPPGRAHGRRRPFLRWPDHDRPGHGRSERCRSCLRGRFRARRGRIHRRPARPRRADARAGTYPHRRSGLRLVATGTPSWPTSPPTSTRQTPRSCTPSSNPWLGLPLTT
jgi:hypothetical protein